MRTSLAAAVTAVALVAVGAATGADIGANDDTARWASDGGAAFFAQMSAVGLKQTVMPVRWTPSEPELIPHEDRLDRVVAQAIASGLQVTLVVYPYPPREVAAGLATPARFAAFVTQVARRYPGVRRFVVLNEPNQPAFLRPQFGRSGANVSAAAAGRLLAAAYDALKTVDPTITVVGVGLSPRGNDLPLAPSNVSTSPVRFIAALGAWYRASGRSRPLMDGFSFHPYPNRVTDSLSRGYAWPNAGFSDLGRIKQALWDAFAGTAQPTTEDGLKLFLDEIGWQVNTSSLAGYTGVENVPVTDEWTQAQIYGEVVRSAACDPDVAAVNFFGFYDDAPRDTGFQSALYRIDGTPRLSAESVRGAIADTALGCLGLPFGWHPATAVVRARRPKLAVTRLAVRVEAAAAEGARALVCVIPGRIRTIAAAAVLEGETATSQGCAEGRVLPGRPFKARIPRPARGSRATVAVRFVAEANPSRATTFSRLLP